MPNTNNLAVEIGPGLGDLTEKLLEKRRVLAVEIDKDLCEILKKKFPKLELKCGDVFDYWQENLVNEAYDLIANLPYYIATRIILKALKDKNAKNILVLIQKEVADKFVARAGVKNNGSISILAQSIAKVTKLFDVPSDAFVPAPKVTSSVILFEKFKGSYDKGFAEFLKTAFASPRKTLKKNLSVLYKFDPDKYGFETNIRPHQINSSTFFQLFSALATERSNNGKKYESSKSKK